MRSVAWEVTQRSATAIELSASGPISPVKAHKRIRLIEDSMEMEFSVEHAGYTPLDFIWGTHPAFAISPDCVLRVPARTGIVGSATRPLLGEPGQRYEWPTMKTPLGSVDMSKALPPGEFAAGHYAAELSAGWYALEFPGKDTGILFEFPLQKCPYLWMWLSYGGWRGYYVAVIEPWTSCPVTLSEALRRTRIASCNPERPSLA